MRQSAPRDECWGFFQHHDLAPPGDADQESEADRQADPRFKMTAEELQAKGIKDFQLYYAIQTLRRTAPPAMAKKR